MGVVLRRALSVLALWASALVPVQAQLVSGLAAGSMAISPPNGYVTTGTQVVDLTLGQLVSQILEHNPDILASLRVLEGAQAGVQSASALPNPRLEYGAGQNQARANTVVPGSVQAWSIIQPVENPWFRNARIDAARSNARIAERDNQVTRNDITAQILVRAYELLLREEEYQAAQESAKILEQVRDKVRLRVEVGEAARYEAIKADAELISARQRQTTAGLMVEQSKLVLNRLAAGALPQQWKLNARLGDEHTLPLLPELQAQVLQTNPELQSLQFSVEKARAVLRQARSSRIPGLEFRYSELRDPEIRQNIAAIGVQIPLLDQRTGPVREASAELARLQTRLDGRRAELEQQVLLAWKALEMANATVIALGQGALPEAESALRVAQAAYQFGERGILEVLDAQRVLRSVRADLLQAKFQTQVARISLEQLAGSLTSRMLGN